MPIIHVHMVEGRTSEQKAAVAKAITDAIVSTLSVSPQSVRILINDLRSDGFYVAGALSAGAAEHARPVASLLTPAKTDEEA